MIVTHQIQLTDHPRNKKLFKKLIIRRERRKAKHDVCRPATYKRYLGYLEW